MLAKSLFAVTLIPARRSVKNARLNRWMQNYSESANARSLSIAPVGTSVRIAFTHHDLRHPFATRCIESGMDIPTVSRWLGHKDGGALAMKTYSHLRREDSLTQ